MRADVEICADERVEDVAGCCVADLKVDWARKAARKLARKGLLVLMVGYGWSQGCKISPSFFLFGFGGGCGCGFAVVDDRGESGGQKWILSFLRPGEGLYIIQPCPQDMCSTRFSCLFTRQKKKISVSLKASRGVVQSSV